MLCCIDFYYLYDTKRFAKNRSYIHFCISISGRGFVYISKHDYSEYDNVFINNRNRPTTVSDWCFLYADGFDYSIEMKLVMIL